MVTVRWAIAVAVMAAAACTATSPGATDDRAPAHPLRLGGTVPSPRPLVTEPAAGWFEAACDLPLDHLRLIRRGYVPGRSPEILVVPREPNFFGGFGSTTHSGPWDYVQRVPLAFYGPGFIRDAGDVSLQREVTLADLAPTLADLLGARWPGDRPGRVLDEVLVPARDRPRPPRVILTVVWDGGGWNVLDRWPGAWPFLRSLMHRGASVQDVTVGSSPSVTPAIHTTIGTGTFPRQHGIVDIPIRDGAGTVNSYEARSPTYLEIQTLADMYDRQVGNRSKIGMLAYKSWHLGMIGHGAYIPGGDRDIAVIAERTQGALVTNPSWYSLPSYLQEVDGFEDDVRTVDLDDGRIDSKWMGHEVLDDATKLRHTPVWTLYQTRLLKALLENEGYGDDRVTDLFFVNYKQIDDVGHDWNMLNPEMREVLGYADDALEDLAAHLDRTVGRGEWVVVYTADHGQSPDPKAVGAWPIHMGILTENVARHFGLEIKELFQDTRPVGFWLDAATMAVEGITQGEIADFVIDYRLEDDVRDDGDIPAQYQERRREPVFAAAFPSRSLPRIWRCATRHR